MSHRSLNLAIIQHVLFVVLLTILGPPAPTHAQVAPGWSAEEDILAKAITIRARELERLSGFRFDSGWQPKVSIEWRLGDSPFDQTDGRYHVEDRKLLFPIRMSNELGSRYKTPTRLLDPEVVANDERFARLADHELGHVLMDHVSRRHRLGPWFTRERYFRLDPEDRIVMNILSEGVAEYFRRIRFPDTGEGSAQYFPTSHEGWRGYPVESAILVGGHWLVAEILRRHGERGLVWIIAHPLAFKGKNIREAVVEYRERALRELAE